MKTIGSLFVIWVFLAILNISLRRAGFDTGVPYWFPISIFMGPTIHLSGIPYLVFFLIVLTFASNLAPKLNMYHVWLIGLFLIILGNLGQGDWDSAFHKPFYESGIQYYHDAIKISSWSWWLESFNTVQQTLLMHTGTHPPFAVLSHYLFLHMSGNRIIFLSMAFVFIASLSIVLVWNIFRVLQVPLEERNLLALLFSVIPAVNIYCAVSLDGLILTGATLFLFGMVVLVKSERISITGLSSMLLGLTMTNLLTYVGVFLIAVAAIQILREFVLSKRFNVAFALMISISFFIAITLVIFSMYGYNYVQGFFTASVLENPYGFSGWHEPLIYFATRVESISEIALFLSFGFLGMLLDPNRLGISWSDWRRIDIGIMLSGLITLFAMFVSGAYRTGETARGALFIYPYIMMALSNANSRILRDLIILAGFQTFGMQLFGGYFW